MLLDDNIVDSITIEQKPAKSNLISVKDLLISAINNEVHHHKRTPGYLSISQIAGDACLRKVFYTRHNYPKQVNENLDSMLRMRVGTWIHEGIQSLLKDSLHEVESFMQCNELKVCGSTDGYFLNKDSDKIILNDFKTCNTNTFTYVLSSGKPLKAHIAQAHWYAYILNKTKGLNIKDLKITYINKNNGLSYPQLKPYVDKLDSTIEYLDKTIMRMIVKEQDITNISIHLSNITSLTDKIKSDLEFNASVKDLSLLEPEFKFDESIMQQQIERVQGYWELENNNEIVVENNKSLPEKKQKKIKLPNKISKPAYCNNCEFYQVCRGDKE